MSRAATQTAPGPPRDEEIQASLAFLDASFRAYYRDHEVALPARFARREYGFLSFRHKFMQRHVGFSSRDAYRRYFQTEAPAHAYYSTAFYRDPAASSMSDKGWLGAELIFDLDADHVPGAKEMDYPAQLDLVKKEFQKLLDEFILGDLGFTEDEVILNFSGGRGYHCHVLAPRVLDLDARARREIVDYVTGKGLEDAGFLRPVTYRAQRAEVDGRAVWNRQRKVPEIPPDAPGWRGRVARGVIRMVEEIAALPQDDARGRLEALDGVGPKKAQSFLDSLTEDRLRRLRSGIFDQHDVFRQLVPTAIGQQAAALARGETDEPVTADVKRLIRLPGSLHGKSGLRVTLLSRKQLDGFDPLASCVPPMDGEATVRPARTQAFPLAGRTWHVEAGRETTLPRAVAVHLVARRQAVVPVGT